MVDLRNATLMNRNEFAADRAMTAVQPRSLQAEICAADESGLFS